MLRWEDIEHLSDQAKLYEIELELDREAPWEQGPYRSERYRLNRWRKRIIRRMQGRDPGSSVRHRSKPGGGMRRDEYDDYLVKKSALLMLEELDRDECPDPEWHWRNYNGMRR